MQIKEIVKEKYGQAALRSCCGAGPDPITSNLYDADQSGQVPGEALRASLGCGNPTALAQLNPGETVLDLGSGGGIDVLLSARRVGPAGKAYGLDMTDEMLALARENQRKAGAQNVEFLKGEIESIPLPDNSVDVVISNCVINLSADKDQALREAFRVLKPGGRFAVSDVVVRGEVPEQVRRSMEMWVGCIAGALEDHEYRAKLAAAGFGGIDIEPTRVYSIADARQFLASEGIDVDAVAPLVENKFMSAFIRAVKPAPKECCGRRAVAEALGTALLLAGIMGERLSGRVNSDLWPDFRAPILVPPSPPPTLLPLREGPVYPSDRPSPGSAPVAESGKPRQAPGEKSPQGGLCRHNHAAEREDPPQPAG